MAYDLHELVLWKSKRDQTALIFLGGYKRLNNKLAGNRTFVKVNDIGVWYIAKHASDTTKNSFVKMRSFSSSMPIASYVDQFTTPVHAGAVFDKVKGKKQSYLLVNQS